MHIKKNTAITAAITAAIVNALACVLFLFCVPDARLGAQTPAPLPSLADALGAPIVTIMDKMEVPAGLSRHDYVSYAPYYWPDPSTPGGLPFIMRDGEPNTEQIAHGDQERLRAFFDNVETLANAWRAHRDAEAARRAVEWLRAWLIAPTTRMNPNLDYAQIRLGNDNNRGTIDGVVDGRGFGKIISDIRDLDNSRTLTAADRETLQQWFNAYLEWLMTSKNGMAARAAQNSDGTWFIAQALPIADYVGRDYLARALSEEAQKRIAVQILRDGSQPLEIQRVDGLSYSAFNLAAYAQIAQAAALVGVDMWNYVSPSRSSLGRAVDFLAPFNIDPSKWPHSQKEELQPGFLNEIIKARSTRVKIALPKAVLTPPPDVATAQSQVAPSVPIAPGVPNTPGVSNTPSVSNTFGAPSVSYTPNVPYTPGVSSASGIPSIPSVPDAGVLDAGLSAAGVSNAGVPNAGVPAVSNVSNVPNISGVPTSMIIVLQKNGSIYVNGKIATAGQLATMLSHVKAVSPNIPVFISMEGNAPIQTLATIMDSCRKQGFTRISVQAQ